MAPAVTKAPTKRNAGRGGKKNPPRTLHGLLTPRNTTSPSPDPAIAKPGTGGQSPDVSQTDSSAEKPDFAAEVFKNAVERVLNAGSDPLKILDFDEKDPRYANEVEKQEGLVSLFFMNATMLHPRGNPTPKAQEAFDRLIQAAKEVKFEEDLINLAANCDGDPIPPHRLVQGVWEQIDDDDDEATPEHGIIGKPAENDFTFYSRHYQAATEFVVMLKYEPDNQPAMKRIHAINDAIFNYTRQHGFTPEKRGLILISLLLPLYRQARPLLSALWDKSYQVKDMNRLQDINGQIAQIVDAHMYPREWVIDIETEKSKGSEFPSSAIEFMVGSTPCVGLPTRPGCVHFDGHEWEILNWVRLVHGNRFLLRRANPEKVRYSLYTFVAGTSLGGRGKAFRESKPEREIVLGTLENLHVNADYLGGIAPVRTLKSKLGDDLSCYYLMPSRDPGKLVWVSWTVGVRACGQQVFETLISNYVRVTKCLLPMRPEYMRIRKPRAVARGRTSSDTPLTSSSQVIDLTNSTRQSSVESAQVIDLTNSTRQSSVESAQVIDLTNSTRQPSVESIQLTPTDSAATSLSNLKALQEMPIEELEQVIAARRAALMVEVKIERD